MKKTESKKYQHRETERLLLGKKRSRLSLFSPAPFSIALFETMKFPIRRETTS